MIFSSYRFLFVFFPIVFAVFCIFRALRKETLVKIWLVLASIAFYAIGEVRFAAIFVASVLLNYLLCFIIDGIGTKKWVKTLCLVLSIAENIGLLIYFKYTNFIIENINRVFGTNIGALSLLLPIGISFFSFQILACTVSVYNGEVKCPAPLDYMLFITFFPQLIVGPVVLHDEMLPQIEGKKLLEYDKNDIMRGVLLFAIGAAKKTVLASPMINYASSFYSGTVAEATSPEAWLAVISFTFAYYFDFSGYIDMARGLGLLFGIRLPVNFNSPYKAVDFADFWRRWNMTISRFFDRTVFNNIFGFGDRLPKLILAVMATFLVSGIWHGAAWHFIIWGLVCGLLVLISNILTLYRVKIPKFLSVPVTFFVMMLVRVLFDAGSMTDAVTVYRTLFSLRGIESALLLAKDNVYLLILLTLGAVICFAAKNSNEICGRNADGTAPRMSVLHIIAAAALLVLSVINMSSVSAFLYFSF